MEQTSDTREYITGYSMTEHEAAFAKSDIVYLTISVGEALAGFFILVLDEVEDSIEFRRVVVAPTYRGIGQQAISEMERFCVEKLNRHRIWLDVFQDNTRAKYIYEKLGYRPKSEEFLGERKLLVYEKLLNF